MKFIFLLLFTSIGFAQNSFVVHYNFTLNEKLYELFPEFNNLENQMETLDIQLHIEGYKSVFFNGNATKENNMAAIFARVNNPLYYDLKTKVFLYNNPERFYLKENEYLIKDDNQENWEITSEQKQINEFTALKAINKTKKNTIAWFVPELNYPFGPGKFNNLPGLIVELQNEQGYYTMSKIMFSNDTSVVLPEKGSHITAEEFSKLQAEIEKEAKRIYNN